MQTQINGHGQHFEYPSPVPATPADGLPLSPWTLCDRLGAITEKLTELVDARVMAMADPGYALALLNCLAEDHLRGRDVVAALRTMAQELTTKVPAEVVARDFPHLVQLITGEGKP